MTAQRLYPRKSRRNARRAAACPQDAARRRRRCPMTGCAGWRRLAEPSGRPDPWARSPGRDTGRRDRRGSRWRRPAARYASPLGSAPRIRTRGSARDRRDRIPDNRARRRGARG